MWKCDVNFFIISEVFIWIFLFRVRFIYIWKGGMKPKFMFDILDIASSIALQHQDNALNFYLIIHMSPSRLPYILENPKHAWQYMVSYHGDDRMQCKHVI